MVINIHAPNNRIWEYIKQKYVTEKKKKANPQLYLETFTLIDRTSTWREVARENSLSRDLTI